MRTNRILAFIASLFLAVLSLAAPAHASFKQTIVDVLSKAGGTPDNEEMLKYAFAYPDKAALVLDHAINQDYPYFALIGAAKALRTKLPESDCVLPTTITDGLFDSADDYVSNQEGKAKSSQMVDTFRSFADEYKANLKEQGKQYTQDQLASSIPYYGDLPVICHVAYHTNFQTEHDLINAASGTVGKAVDAYKQFSNGSYVQGIGTIISMNLSKEVACAALSSGLSSTGVGSIPGFNSVASGVCSGILGTAYKFIAGALEWGLEAAHDLNCAINPFADCSDGPPPPPKPPTPDQIADTYCAQNGDVKTFSSKDGFTVFECKNHASCQVKTDAQGLPSAQCIDSAEWHQDNDNKYQTEGPADMKAMTDRWMAQCLTGCDFIKVLTASQLGIVKKIHAADPDFPYALARDDYFSDHSQLARDLRSTVIDQAWKVYPTKWYDGQFSLISTMCKDDECEFKAKGIAGAARTELDNFHQQNPDVEYSLGAVGILSKATKDIKSELFASRQRLEGRAGAGRLPGNINAPSERLQPAVDNATPRRVIPDGPISRTIDPGMVDAPKAPPRGTIPSPGPAPMVVEDVPGPLTEGPRPQITDPGPRPFRAIPGLAKPAPAPSADGSANDHSDAAEAPAAPDESHPESTSGKGAHPKKGKKGKKSNAEATKGERG